MKRLLFALIPLVSFVGVGRADAVAMWYDSCGNTAVSYSNGHFGVGAGCHQPGVDVAKVWAEVRCNSGAWIQSSFAATDYRQTVYVWCPTGQSVTGVGYTYQGTGA